MIFKKNVVNHIFGYRKEWLNLGPIEQIEEEIKKCYTFEQIIKVLK